jgi:PhnB protein
MLGGKVVAMMTYGEAPDSEQISPESRHQIMHVQLTVNDMILMGSDTPSEHFNPPQGFAVSLQFDDVAEAERMFHALKENGKVQMPFQETFWAARFGVLVDQFGIPWMINCAPEN